MGPPLERKRLDQLIEENASRIIDRFVNEVREHALPARSLTPAEVADHLHRYLLEMVAVLRAGHSERVESSPSAKEHGEQRWYVGYDLKSVILEYGVFRRVILDILKGLGVELTLEEFDPLGHFLHVAVADAAVEFTANSLAQVNEALRVAERANDARDEILAIVSHDLKNPLNVIHGSVAMMARRLEDGGDLNEARAELTKGLARIQRAGATMNTLVNGLLELGRSRAGELLLDLKDEHVDAMVAEAVDQAAPLAEQRGVRLLSDATEGGMIACDRGRVLQVLGNLLGNAIKFTPERGIVTVRTRSEADACLFEVTDTGPGIPAERLPYLFNRYWQAPDAAARGTGLGLAIAKSFVELHGGTIGCESTPGEGSRFFFRLPQKPKP